MNPFESCIFDRNLRVMRYAIIIGILLIVIGLISGSIGKYEFSDLVTVPEFALGLFFGGGIGIIIGGLLGWMYKKPYSKNDVKPTVTPSKEELPKDL